MTLEAGPEVVDFGCRSGTIGNGMIHRTGHRTGLDIHRLAAVCQGQVVTDDLQLCTGVIDVTDGTGGLPWCNTGIYLIYAMAALAMTKQGLVSTVMEGHLGCLIGDRTVAQCTIPGLFSGCVSNRTALARATAVCVDMTKCTAAVDGSNYINTAVMTISARA